MPEDTHQQPPEYTPKIPVEDGEKPPFRPAPGKVIITRAGVHRGEVEDALASDRTSAYRRPGEATIKAEGHIREVQLEIVGFCVENTDLDEIFRMPIVGAVTDVLMGVFRRFGKCTCRHGKSESESGNGIIIEIFFDGGDELDPEKVIALNKNTYRAMDGVEGEIMKAVGIMDRVLVLNASRGQIVLTKNV